MNKVQKKHWGRFVLVLFLVWLFLGFGLTGKVIDSKTNKPIANAFVVVTWEGSSILGFELNKYCMKSMITKTNANGRYYFPFWIKPLSSWPVIGAGFTISFYKPGFIEYIPKDSPAINFTQTYYLKKFEGSREERLTHLSIFPMGCQDNKGSGMRKKLGYAIYSEAEKIMKLDGGYNTSPTKMDFLLFDGLRKRYSKIDD